MLYCLARAQARHPRQSLGHVVDEMQRAVRNRLFKLASQAQQQGCDLGAMCDFRPYIHEHALVLLPERAALTGTRCSLVFGDELKKILPKFKRRVILTGSPATLKHKLDDLVRQYQADELFIVSIIHDHAARRRSYELIAQALGALT